MMHDDAPSAAELRAEELQEEFDRQTCGECGYDRAGCNCPDGKCDCVDAWDRLRDRRDGWWEN